MSRITALSLFLVALQCWCLVSGVFAASIPAITGPCPASSGKTASIPSSAIVVAKDGSGSYKTIQAAINSISMSNSVEKVVYIKAGTYNETVSIPQNNITLVGDGQCKTIIAYNNYKAIIGSTSNSTTVQAQGSDFRAFHITFMNYAPWPLSTNAQAPAFYSKGARTYIQDCGFISGEDTLLVFYGNAYFKNCYIEGDVDFVWGYGGAEFVGCEFRIKGYHSKPVITAHGGSYSNFSTGFWIHGNSKITYNSTVSSGSVVLGRPWKTYAYVTYSKTEMPAIINSTGWNLGLGDFSTTCKLGEVKGSNNGTGADTSKRVSWSKLYSSEPTDRTPFIGSGSTSWLSKPIY